MKRFSLWFITLLLITATFTALLQLPTLTWILMYWECLHLLHNNRFYSSSSVWSLVYKTLYIHLRTYETLKEMSHFPVLVSGVLPRQALSLVTCLPGFTPWPISFHLKSTSHYRISRFEITRSSDCSRNCTPLSPIITTFKRRRGFSLRIETDLGNTWFQKEVITSKPRITGIDLFVP